MENDSLLEKIVGLERRCVNFEANIIISVMTSIFCNFFFCYKCKRKYEIHYAPGVKNKWVTRTHTILLSSVYKVLRDATSWGIMNLSWKNRITMYVIHTNKAAKVDTGAQTLNLVSKIS